MVSSIPDISVIITTYNRPDALALVLQALAIQTVQNFEVIIADDGSTIITQNLINHLRSRLPYPIVHLWQEDKGFRAAMARNRAIAIAQARYIIFLDGDCLPLEQFISRHQQLAESGHFVTGNRILLTADFTAQVIAQSLPLGSWSYFDWIRAYLRRDCNRLLPLLFLPNGRWRTWGRQRWQGAKTCNLAVWREDLVKINGFNEKFQGWGHEDAELVVRLLRSGLRRKEGRFSVPVLHLWHPEQDRSQETNNRQQLQQVIESTMIRAVFGLDQYLPDKMV